MEAFILSDLVFFLKVGPIKGVQFFFRVQILQGLGGYHCTCPL